MNFINFMVTETADLWIIGMRVCVCVGVSAPEAINI